MFIYVALLIAGFIGGLLAGTTGVGTGFIMIAVIPIALQYMGVPDELTVRLTIANTIFATLCSAIANNLQLIRKGDFYWKETLILAVSAGSIAVLLLLFVVYQPGYTAFKYNLIIVSLMGYIIIRTIYKLRKRLKNVEHMTTSKLLATGISGGAIAALTGLGGGSVIIPMLNLWMKVNIKKAKTITYGTIMVIAVLLTIINFQKIPAEDIDYAHMGHIIFPVALPLAAGAILGSPIGLKVGDKLSTRTVHYMFLTIISIVMIRKCVELFG